MKVFRKIKTFLNNPRVLLLILAQKNVIRLNDENFIKLFWKTKFKTKLDLNNPIGYNEKIQWLKLNDRKEIYSTMVDKHLAKDYVKNIIGEEYIIPTYGVYENFDDIDFSKLPNKFVMKCNHDSASVIVCKDKKTFDIKKAKKRINKCLHYKFYNYFREWPYKNVKPLIIIEKYIDSDDGKPLKDYKFFCFNGEPKLLYLSEGMDNHETASMGFYDMDLNLLPIKRKDYKMIETKQQKPKNYNKMIEIASKLSKGICHLRVDLYNVDGKIYFGELTFFTSGGCIPFEKEEDNIMLGNYIDLKVVKDEK